MPPPLLTTEDLAAQLQVPAKTLRNWRSLSQGPPYMHVGRHVRYRESEVDAWLAARSREVA